MRLLVVAARESWRQEPRETASDTQQRSTVWRHRDAHAGAIRVPRERVDVSLDGGKNWRPARIDGPSLDKSIHRFYYDFDWDGSPLLLQSRAMDSTGYVQPTKAELRAVRGTNSIYHNNGIQTWHVMANGEVENVEVS